MGGKSSKSVTTGYKYFMGVQTLLCYGPVDEVLDIYIGERLAIQPNIQTSGSFYINQPQLFGGDKVQGGAVGWVDVMMGEPDQQRNDYLVQYQGAQSPAYRGILSLVFRSFQWTSNSPYLKKPWFRVRRILKGWHNDRVWNGTQARIGDYDMNPAHILFQALTDPTRGMGYGFDDVDQITFGIAAAKLVEEKFGLTIRYKTQSAIEDFVQDILNHINGVLRLNMKTGKFELILIRDDYNLDDLEHLDESNCTLMSFSRGAYGELVNSVTIQYKDRDGNDKPATVQNPAAIELQGGVIGTTISYPGIRDDTLASQVAQRELNLRDSPIAKARVVTDRRLWNHEQGDVVTLSWSNEPFLNRVPFRIISISKGTLTDGKIDVEMVEDVFGLPDDAYTRAPDSEWTNPLVPPVRPDASRAVEMPYWDAVRGISQADLAFLDPDYGFGMTLVSRGAIPESESYVLSASPDDVNYTDVATGHYLAVGDLSNAIGPLQTTISLSGAFELDEIDLEDDPVYAYIGNECVEVRSVNVDSGLMEIGRGVLDTTPRSHPINTRVFVVSPGAAYDPTERTAGELVYYRPRPSTGLGTLPLDDADTLTLVLNNRPSRPYPPGNLRINGGLYPATVNGPGVYVTWAHRDRLTQTVDLVDHEQGDIGPEEGVNYILRLYSGVTLLRTYDIGGQFNRWDYPYDHDNADGNLATFRVAVSSVRNGLESWQAAEWTFTRLTTSGTPGYETPPATPTLSVTPGNLTLNLSWVFGDARTNLEYTELRVSKTISFDEGQTLQFVDYPDQLYSYTGLQMGDIMWFWARVADVNGQLSPWSARVMGQVSIDTSFPTVTTLPIPPNPGEYVVNLLDETTGKSKLYVWNPDPSDPPNGQWLTGVEAQDILGFIVGNQILAGSITGDRIAANQIVAAHLTAGSVTAEKIQAGAVDAEKIDVDELSAISANMGALTAGSITLNADGSFIKSGTANYDTLIGALSGSGFWVGRADGDDKMMMGQRSGKHFRWENGQLIVEGDLIATGNLLNNAVTNTLTLTGNYSVSGTFNMISGIVQVNLSVLGESVSYGQIQTGFANFGVEFYIDGALYLRQYAAKSSSGNSISQVNTFSFPLSFSQIIKGVSPGVKSVQARIVSYDIWGNASAVSRQVVMSMVEFKR